ncbi:MAG: hypothetical protein Q4D02_00050 [Clostridia bacterium]|nr:hypothetical protein [Clostridia bacterium]
MFSLSAVANYQEVLLGKRKCLSKKFMKEKLCNYEIKKIQLE